MIDNTYYKRLIVKSPCFTVKAAGCLSSHKRLFACGTQFGQLFVADADREPTDSHERLFYYQSRYYDTTVYLENEKRDPRILLPECNSPFFRMRFAIVETGRLHSTSIFDLLWYDQDTKIISVGADLVC